jgi:nitroimidazol reductase NimA-like FMN-containing flavoprotein (pyridoxamine 5'-phosphate oxidase superfamily)
MTSSSAPAFRELDRQECEALLARNQVGRIAFAFHDRVDIQAIHYVHHGDWLYVRTAPGAKIMTIAHNHWVAFEVDEIDGTFDWRSVVVRGSVYVLDPEGTKQDQRAYLEAAELLRMVIPETLRSHDPVPFRYMLLRIHIDEITGRAATTSTG